MADPEYPSNVSELPYPGDGEISRIKMQILLIHWVQLISVFLLQPSKLTVLMKMHTAQRLNTCSVRNTLTLRLVQDTSM